MLLRFLVFALLAFLVLRAVWRFLGGVVEGATRAPRGRSSQPPARGVPMVRDPVCGTFVVPGRALTLNEGGVLLHFCSEDCRQAYRAKIGARRA